MPDRGKDSRILEGLENLPRPCVDPLEDAESGPNGLDPVGAALARGREEGLAEGERRAAESFERQLATTREEVSNALKQLAELQGGLAREFKALMVELALEAASTIVRAKIDEGDPVAARAVAQAVDALPRGETIRARLHPDDVESVQRDLEELITKRRIELHPDETVSRGGCLVSSEAGRIDATVETAGEKVRAAAQGRMEQP